MRISQYLLFCLFGWSLIGGHGFGESPNVVFIVSDDQGWSDYGFMGHETIQTPHLDRLAERSLVLPRGYVAAPFAVTEIRGWDDVDPDTVSHVVVLEGIGGMRPVPPEGRFRSRLVASRRQGEGGAHVWRVAPREDRGAGPRSGGR